MILVIGKSGATIAMYPTSPSRRAFVGAMSAAEYSGILGANDRVGLGLIGCHLTNLFKAGVIGDPEANAHLVRPYREPWAGVLWSFRL